MSPARCLRLCRLVGAFPHSDPGSKHFSPSFLDWLTPLFQSRKRRMASRRLHPHPTFLTPLFHLAAPPPFPELPPSRAPAFLFGRFGEIALQKFARRRQVEAKVAPSMREPGTATAASFECDGVSGSDWYWDWRRLRRWYGRRAHRPCCCAPGSSLFVDSCTPALPASQPLPTLVSTYWHRKLNCWCAHASTRPCRMVHCPARRCTECLCLLGRCRSGFCRPGRHSARLSSVIFEM